MRRSRLRSYLLLARVSNLPTVWSNVLAGVTLGASAAPVPGAAVTSLVLLCIAASAFYTGGMFLNDAFDQAFDRQARPERPLPRGDVASGEVFAVGGACLALGEAFLWPNRTALALGALLAVAIVRYDMHHKGSRSAPLLMGVCRGLVYAIGAAAFGLLPPPVLAGAVLMVLYVASLTVVAKRAGHNARWLVPALIAGISLVDATVIGVATGAWGAAALAAVGFPLTLVLQRWVPGD